MGPAVSAADLADLDLSLRASTALAQDLPSPACQYPRGGQGGLSPPLYLSLTLSDQTEQELTPAPRTSSLAQHGNPLRRPGTPLPFLVMEGRWEPVSGHVCQLPGAGGHFLKASPSGRQPALPCAPGSWQLAHLIFRPHRVGFCRAHLPPLPSGSHPQRTGRASCLNVSPWVMH